jgi:hypothetical protein
MDSKELNKFDTSCITLFLFLDVINKEGKTYAALTYVYPSRKSENSEAKCTGCSLNGLVTLEIRKLGNHTHM